MSKKEILKALKDGRTQFLSTIDGLSEMDMEKPTVMAAWSVKDIMVHLTMWEAELIKLLWQSRQGRKPTTAHFSKESINEINEKWYQDNRSRPLDRVMEDFIGVRTQTIRRLEDFSEEELENPDLFPWLNGLTIREKVARSSYIHEAEHEHQIKLWRQEQKI